MKRELDYDVLRKALHDLTEHTDETFHSVATMSGVFNIKKTIDGENRPVKKSWQKLHEAFPKYIPPPTYKDGGINNKFKMANTVNQTTGSVIYNGDNLTAQQRTLIDLLNEHDKNGEIVRDMIFELLKKGRDESNS